MDLVSTSPESLTSRSTASVEMELDTVSVNAMEHSPPRTTSGSTRNTPMIDIHNSLNADADKGIIVDAPTVDFADSSAMLIANEDDEDEGEEDEEVVVTPYHKRKRTSVNYILDDANYTKVARASPPEGPPVKRSRQGPKVRGVIIGVWRDSSIEDDLEKHVIFGFIDIHERLRTRIYAMNRRGEELIANIPTGAGGCWVTFERVIFESHLKGLGPAQVKEYVRIRSDAKPEATHEERQEAEQKAVLKAVSVVAEEALNPTVKAPVNRQSLGRTNNNRQSLPKQTLHKAPSFQAVNAADMQTPKPSPFTDGKPTSVLLGYWADSSEPNDVDKHAVFGVLSGTDCFRVKVQRVTRDGRYVDGNFPVGAGAMWLHYDKVVFEPHLIGMTRPEVKEYCRVRQRHIEDRESEKDRKANELKAVKEAKAIMAGQPSNGVVDSPQGRRSPELEVRHSARSEQRMAARQQVENDAAAEKLRKEKVEARERQNEKTRKEVAMAEAVIQEAAQQELKNNIKKLNKVWVAQQAATMPGMSNSSNGVTPVPEQEVRYHHGIKYERKQNGPFQGKLVSQPQILNIDGEDYVEYRVLTKPSF